MAAVCLSDPGGNTALKVKVEGSSGSLRKKKIGYAPPVFAEPPILFPFTLSRGYTRKEFAEKYDLNHSGMSPKQLRDTDVTDAELVSFFGPTVNKNGHRYMFLNDEALIERIERMWMVCHQKSVVLQSRLITKAMAKGFYVQEVKKKSPNWALYAEWTNNEQLRRRLKSKKVESNGEGLGFSDGEEEGEFEEGGSTQSKVTAQEAGSRHGGVIRDQQGVEVFTAPGGLPEMITCWKTYFGVAHAQVVEAQQILQDAKSGKDELMQSDLKARSQVDFCEAKLRSTRQKCTELQAAVNTLRDSVDNGVEVGEDLPLGTDVLKNLSQQVQVQESLVQAFEDCLDEANLELLKVTGDEGLVCALVSDAELRLMQADRHERAVKLVISRLEIGTYLYRSVPPRPYSEVVIGDPPVQHVLNKCVACGLGFAPVWAVKLGSCCHPYHEWCSRIHFESNKFCIAPDCGLEMHEGWWVSTGLLKPGIAAPLKSTVERFPQELEATLLQGQLPVSEGEISYPIQSHVLVQTIPLSVLGFRVYWCFGGLID